MDFPFSGAPFTGVLRAKAAPKKGKFQALQRLKALHFAVESTTVDPLQNLSGPAHMYERPINDNDIRRIFAKII